jgi:hypothetical protein
VRGRGGTGTVGYDPMPSARSEVAAIGSAVVAAVKRTLGLKVSSTASDTTPPQVGGSSSGFVPPAGVSPRQQSGAANSLNSSGPIPESSAVKDTTLPPHLAASSRAGSLPPGSPSVETRRTSLSISGAAAQSGSAQQPIPPSRAPITSAGASVLAAAKAAFGVVARTARPEVDEASSEEEEIDVDQYPIATARSVLRSNSGVFSKTNMPRTNLARTYLARVAAAPHVVAGPGGKVLPLVAAQTERDQRAVKAAMQTQWPVWRPPQSLPPLQLAHRPLPRSVHYLALQQWKVTS